MALFRSEQHPLSRNAAGLKKRSREKHEKKKASSGRFCAGTLLKISRTSNSSLLTEPSAAWGGGLWRGLSNLVFVMCLMSAWVSYNYRKTSCWRMWESGGSFFFTPFVTEKGNRSRCTSFIENMGSHICTGVYVPSWWYTLKEKAC